MTYAGEIQLKTQNPKTPIPRNPLMLFMLKENAFVE